VIDPRDGDAFVPCEERAELLGRCSRQSQRCLKAVCDGGPAHPAAVADPVWGSARARSLLDSCYFGVNCATAQLIALPTAAGGRTVTHRRCGRRPLAHGGPAAKRAQAVQLERRLIEHNRCVAEGQHTHRHPSLRSALPPKPAEPPTQVYRLAPWRYTCIARG
jgi:hypothetical protein